MPAPKVRADYDQLSKITQLFNQEAESTERTLRDMTQRMQVLQGGDWIGEGAQAFYTEMEQGVVPAFNRLINALRAASLATQTINGLMKETEQTASSTFKKGASRVSSGRSAEGMSAAGGAGAAGAEAAGAVGATVGAAAATAGTSAGAAASASASASPSGTVPSWLSNLLGTNGSSQTQASGNLLDQFTNQLHQVRDSLATGSGTGANASDSDFPSQQILDAVKNDLASQSQVAANGWQQAGTGSGGGSGGASGSGSGGGGSGAGKSAGGGGGGSGGGSSPNLSGGGLGSGSSSQVSGQQGIVSDNAATGGGSGGGLFGGGDSAGSFGAAVVAGITRGASGAGAPLAQVILTVGASAGGLLFATKGGQSGGVSGWATGQFAQNAASPIYRAARG